MRQAKVGDKFNAWVICYEGKPLFHVGMLQAYRYRGEAEMNCFERDQLVRVEVVVVPEKRGRK